MPRAGSIKLQIASSCAYLVTASRMGSWLVVSALLYRCYGATAFATLALVRGVVGILNYATVGIGPAVIHLATRVATEPVSFAGTVSRITTDNDRHTLDYASPRPTQLKALLSQPQQAFNAGLLLSALVLVVSGVWTAVYAVPLPYVLGLTGDGRIEELLRFFALGTLFRLCSDSSGAYLQASGKIVLDNLMLCFGEILWVIIAVPGLRPMDITESALQRVGWAYFISGLALLILRVGVAYLFAGVSSPFSSPNWRMVRDLLAFGSIVMIAQLADYLYAPTDFLLIKHLMDMRTVAVYAPAVQIDAALLLLVSGLSAVILPRSALAHSRGDARVIRQYYVRGTWASLGLLIFGALLAWAVAPWAFWIWLHNRLPATCAILPLVLIHTVIGGSSAVGRSILLGIGKVRAFAAAALIAGAANVVLSYCFVRYCGLGLRGIILGTIVAVVGRCAIWMPWYVMKQVRHADALRWERVELVE